MTREELDWLYRLRSEIYVYMPREWLIPMNNALDMAFKALEQEPCEESINRQDALDAIARIGLSKSGTKEVQAVAECLRAVEKLPSVTPRQRTGHWKDCGEREPWYSCSKCGEKTWGSCYNYCPHCGARMIKLQERNDEK